MKTKLFTSISLVLTLMIALTWTEGAVSAEPACDSDYVTQAGNVISVQPNGIDDTVNLQCAFDVTLAYGAGATVQLEEGLFHTGQIVVYGFQGEFTGSGMDKTVIENLPNLYVTFEDFFLAPPSAENPWPSLFSFVGGNYYIADLAIRIVGEEPTTGWTFLGLGPVKELAVGIGIFGSEAHVEVDRVSIQGEHLEPSFYGYNLVNGIYMEGFMGELPWQPISGSLDVENSVFKRLGSGTPVANLVNAKVTISHNQYEDIFYGADVADLFNTEMTFVSNQVEEATFGYIYYQNFNESSSSEIQIRNNTFSGVYGLFFDGPLSQDNECLLVGNNVQHVSDIGIYLGPDVQGCTVIGGGTKTNVLDLGTDNILSGVNNMGVGIGPDIRQLLWKKP